MLEALKNFLKYLEISVIVLLFFIAVKLAVNATAHIFHHGFEISAQISLFIILAILGVGVVVGLVKK